MDLILWRHAEAIDLDLVGDDMLRSLTSKGEKQATRMAAWLDRQLPELPQSARATGQPVLVAVALRATRSRLRCSRPWSRLRLLLETQLPRVT